MGKSYRNRQNTDMYPKLKKANKKQKYNFYKNSNDNDYWDFG